MKKTTLLFLLLTSFFCLTTYGQKIIKQDSIKSFASDVPLPILNTGCNNMDFSTNTSDWTYHWSKLNAFYGTRPSQNTSSFDVVGGMYGSISLPTIVDNINESRFEVLPASTFDTRLGQAVAPGAPSGAKVLLIGRTDEVPNSPTDEGQRADSGQEEVSKKFTVSNDNAVLQYGYAVVFERPTHSDFPNTFEVFIEVNGQSLAGCEVIRYTFNNSGENGFIPSSANPNDVVKRWTVNAIDLLSHPDINLGDEIAVSFRVRDCGRNGHGSYAYVSAECLTKDGSIQVSPNTDPNCIDEPKTFTATTDVENPEDLNWTITLGSTTVATYSGSDTITHTFESPGNHLISLSVTTANGCSLTYTRDFLVDECNPCVDPCGMEPDFTYLTAPNQCTVVFNGINNGDICPEQTFEWTIDGVVVSNDEIFSHTFPGNGTYEVCYTIIGVPTGGQRECRVTECKTVTIDCEPQGCTNACGMDADFTYFANQCNVSFNGINNGDVCPGQVFEWTVNGVIVSSDEDFSYVFPESGTYDVCFTIYGSGGQRPCEDKICRTVTVNCGIISTNDCPDSSCIYIYPHAASNGFCGDTAAILSCVDDSEIQQIEWRYKVGGLDELITIDTTPPFNGQFIPIYFSEPGDWDNYYFWVHAIITYNNGDVCDVSNFRLMDCDGDGGMQRITLTPNPIKHTQELQIKGIDSKDIISIEVYDLFGTRKKTINPSRNKFDVKDLSSGIYFIRFNTTQGVISKKLIIE